MHTTTANTTGSVPTPEADPQAAHPARHTARDGRCVALDTDASPGPPPYYGSTAAGVAAATGKPRWVVRRALYRAVRLGVLHPGPHPDTGEPTVSTLPVDGHIRH